jgi:hypothetical protein
MSALRLSRAAIPVMREGGGGSIVNLASLCLDVLLQSIDLEVAAEELVPTAPTSECTTWPGSSARRSRLDSNPNLLSHRSRQDLRTSPQSSTAREARPDGSRVARTYPARVAVRCARFPSQRACVSSRPPGGAQSGRLASLRLRERWRTVTTETITWPDLYVLSVFCSTDDARPAWPVMSNSAPERMYDLGWLQTWSNTDRYLAVLKTARTFYPDDLHRFERMMWFRTERERFVGLNPAFQVMCEEAVDIMATFTSGYGYATRRASAEQPPWLRNSRASFAWLLRGCRTRCAPSPGSN